MLPSDRKRGVGGAAYPGCYTAGEGARRRLQLIENRPTPRPHVGWEQFIQDTACLEEGDWPRLGVGGMTRVCAWSGTYLER